MADGPAPVEQNASSAPVGKLKEFFGRFRKSSIVHPNPQPESTPNFKGISTSEVTAEPSTTIQTSTPEAVKFDEHGEAIGPWAVRKSDKTDDFVLFDTRTNEPAGVYADLKVAQKFANRGNAIEALRKQLKKT